ncbi:hypothetical protein GW916_14400 [bacterium]|nr:hypothetical protein [bacterium]
MKHFKNKKNSKLGTTLVELLIAATILGVGLAAGAAGLQSFGQIKFKVVGTKAKNDISVSLIENIRSNISKYQAHFQHSGAKSSPGSEVTYTNLALAPENLPFAWSNNYMGGVDGCPECPGRYGYVIQPKDSFQHLYQVTIRITNPEIFEGFRDYIFVTGDK